MEPKCCPRCSKCGPKAILKGGFPLSYFLYSPYIPPRKLLLSQFHEIFSATLYEKYNLPSASVPHMRVRKQAHGCWINRIRIQRTQILNTSARTCPRSHNKNTQKCAQESPANGDTKCPISHHHRCSPKHIKWNMFGFHPICWFLNYTYKNQSNYFPEVLKTNGRAEDTPSQTKLICLVH